MSLVRKRVGIGGTVVQPSSPTPVQAPEPAPTAEGNPFSWMGHTMGRTASAPVHSDLSPIVSRPKLPDTTTSVADAQVIRTLPEFRDRLDAGKDISNAFLQYHADNPTPPYMPKDTGVRPGVMPPMNAVQQARMGMGGTPMPGSYGHAIAGYMNGSGVPWGPSPVSSPVAQTRTGGVAASPQLAGQPTSVDTSAQTNLEKKRV